MASAKQSKKRRIINVEGPKSKVESSQSANRESRPKDNNTELANSDNWRVIFEPFKWLWKHIIPGFIRNSFRELPNVTWPSRKQSRQLTLAVILFSILFAVIISSVDYGLDKVFRKVFLHE